MTSDTTTLTKADYQAAAKKVNVKTKEDSFFLLKFNSSCKLVVPHKAGIAIMDALSEAMYFNESYSSPPVFKQLEDDVEMRPFSSAEITDIKVAQLLNMSLYDTKRLKESET